MATDQRSSKDSAQQSSVWKKSKQTADPQLCALVLTHRGKNDSIPAVYVADGVTGVCSIQDLQQLFR